MLAAPSSGNQLPDWNGRREVERLQAMKCQSEKTNYRLQLERRGSLGEVQGEGGTTNAVGEAEDFCSSVPSGCEQF